MAVLGMDLGQKRIGLAISEQGKIAKRLTTINLGKSGFAGFVTKLEETCRAFQVKKIIIGLPKSLDERIGPEATKVKKRGKKIAEKLNLPVDFEEEYFSTKLSHDSLEREGFSRQKRKKLIDAESARIILQAWLDR